MIVYKATYKCRYCERKFDSGYHYCGLDDAVHHFDSCMKFQPVHFCKGGHVSIGDFVGFERVDEKRLIFGRKLENFLAELSR